MCWELPGKNMFYDYLFSRRHPIDIKIIKVIIFNTLKILNVIIWKILWWIYYVAGHIRLKEVIILCFIAW